MKLTQNFDVYVQLFQPPVLRDAMYHLLNSTIEIATLLVGNLHCLTHYTQIEIDFLHELHWEHRLDRSTGLKHELPR